MRKQKGEGEGRVRVEVCVSEDTLVTRDIFMVQDTHTNSPQ